MNENETNLLQVELDGILKASNDNIVIAEGDGKVLKVSPNCEAIYGKSQSYLVGKSVFELEEEDIFAPSVTARVLKERKEVQLMQKTVNDRVVMATGIPVFDKNKNILRIISFSHDLTEIHKLREDYEQLQVRMQKYQSEIEELKEKDSSNKDAVIKSKKMKKIMDLIKQVARSDATVLLTGETGVGKNVFAQALHDNSERKVEQLIEVNCGSVPPSLFESEMFGYEAGSFTGANKKGKTGLIEMADQGTLFLDEIGELPLEIQVKLLQVLQNKKVTRIGGNSSQEVDFRLVVATNQNLENKVAKGEFRQDLFYRLNVIPVEIPSLRERKEDIYDASLFVKIQREVSSE